MSLADQTQAAPPSALRASGLVSWRFVVGVILFLGPLLVAAIAWFLVDSDGLRIAALAPLEEPSTGHWLGSDSAGRDVLALLIHSTPPTYLIGTIAGCVAIGLGTVIGLVSGYARGFADTIARAGIDVLLGIPALAVVVVLASVLGAISPLMLGLIIGAFAWAYPARQIRSQVLSLREQPFISVSRLSDEGALRIMFVEILPNVLPFVVAAFVASVSFSILVAVGLQLLGIGGSEPTLGLVLQLAISGGALSRGMWWWWAPPALILVAMFLGLFLLSLAIDTVANPRLREGGDDG